MTEGYTGSHHNFTDAAVGYGTFRNGSIALGGQDLQIQQLNLIRWNQGLPPLLPMEPQWKARGGYLVLLAVLLSPVVGVAAALVTGAALSDKSKTVQAHFAQPDYDPTVPGGVVSEISYPGMGVVAAVLVIVTIAWFAIVANPLWRGYALRIEAKRQRWREYWSTHYYGVHS